MKRNRTWYFFLVLIVIGLGLLSRVSAPILPNFINLFLGDTIWGAMIYSIMAFIMPTKSSKIVAFFSLSFCYTIEFTQLYHAPWIDTIRNTTLGGLILGFGFLWSDLLVYTIGVGLLFIIEYKLIQKKSV